MGVYGEHPISQVEPYDLPPGDRDGSGLADLMVGAYLQDDIWIRQDRYRAGLLGDISGGNNVKYRPVTVLDPEREDCWEKMHRLYGDPRFGRGYYVTITNQDPLAPSDQPVAVIVGGETDPGVYAIARVGDQNLTELWDALQRSFTETKPSEWKPDLDPDAWKAAFNPNWAKQLNDRFSLVGNLRASQPNPIAFEGQLASDGYQALLHQHLLNRDVTAQIMEVPRELRPSSHQLS
jgi:hypothetical protein